MNFDPNNFREVQYNNSKLYFDKGYSFHEHFKHKQKTRKFPFYRNILKFLEENPNTKIYFTLNEEMKTFQQVSDGFLLNMCVSDLYPKKWTQKHDVDVFFC